VRAIAVSRDGRQIYVVDWMDDAMTVLDAGTLKPVATIATGRNSRAFGRFLE
jgi:YVTN family beta-propeller protein